MNAAASPAVALLYPGSRALRQRADPAESHFAALFAAFEASSFRAMVPASLQRLRTRD